MRRFKVLLYDNMNEAGKVFLRERTKILFPQSLNEASLIEEAREVDGIIIQSKGKETRKMMESTPQLKVIGRHGVGVETIDLETSTEKGIGVVNTPDANDISVGEHFFCLVYRMAPGNQRIN